MLSVAEAQALVLRHAPLLSVETVRAGLTALGSILAEDVVSDFDSPPFAKSMVDGYAVRSADLPRSANLLRIAGEVLAGQTYKKIVGSGETVCIMTGAPIPAGSDAVVMLEKTTLTHDSGAVTIPGPVPAGQNILPRGAEMRSGDNVLTAGTRLRPQELGILATLGKTRLQVYRRPVMAVLSTGDEVIEPGEDLQPGQIRNSNAVMLQAQTARAGVPVQYLGIARDDVASLRPFLEQGLGHDVLLITGGVSAGKVDLVPNVLAELGVEAIFHKVSMKPGKPILFGRRGATLAFGLPGNPVSAYVARPCGRCKGWRKTLVCPSCCVRN
jgi:molybdopterin molybdotransferase